MTIDTQTNQDGIEFVAIKATCIEPLSPEIETQGVYVIQLDELSGSDVAREAALDIFHTKIGIDNLEDFEIEVMTMEGEILESGDYGEAHDSYSMSDAGDIDNQMSLSEWDDLLFSQESASKPG